MPSSVERRTIDLSAYPDLVVIYLGMRVNHLTGGSSRKRSMWGGLLVRGGRVGTEMAASNKGRVVPRSCRLKCRRTNLIFPPLWLGFPPTRLRFRAAA
jgi:hypothetical protein